MMLPEKEQLIANHLYQLITDPGFLYLFTLGGEKNTLIGATIGSSATATEYLLEEYDKVGSVLEDLSYGTDLDETFFVHTMDSVFIEDLYDVICVYLKIKEGTTFVLYKEHINVMKHLCKLMGIEMRELKSPYNPVHGIQRQGQIISFWIGGGKPSYEK